MVGYSTPNMLEIELNLFHNVQSVLMGCAECGVLIVLNVGFRWTASAWKPSQPQAVVQGCG